VTRPDIKAYIGGHYFDVISVFWFCSAIFSSAGWAK